MFGGSRKVRPVVVTYASADRREALALVAALEEQGVRIWVSPRDVDPKRGTADQVHQAIRDAPAVLMVVSPAANDSRLLKTETEIAVGHAPILPVRIADVTPAQALWSLVQTQPNHDLFGPDREAGLDRLVVATLALQGGRRRPRPAAPAPLGDAQGDDDAPTAARTDAEGPPPLGHNAALRCFVGARANAFLDRWRLLERRETATLPFWPGLAFGRYWFAYRKLWPAAAGSSLAAIALLVFAFRNDAHYGVIGVPTAILGLALLRGMAWLRGVSLYHTHAERGVDRINRAGVGAGEAAAALHRAGGTSALAVLAMLAVEAAAVAALVHRYDRAAVARWLSPPPPVPAERMAIVDMTRPADGRSRYTFCLVNPTDYTVNFLLRYGTAPAQNESIAPHSRAYSYWSRSIEPPVISFDHVLGDGATYTDRSYGLETAKTDDASRCGGVVYDFVQTDNDLDLKLRGRG